MPQEFDKDGPSRTVRPKPRTKMQAETIRISEESKTEAFLVAPSGSVNCRAGSRRPRRGAPAGSLAAWLCMALLYFSARGHAQNSLRWVTNYYAVTGATWPEIEDSLNRVRPAGLQPPLTGLTEWRIGWHIVMVSSPGGCRCSSFTTQTTITNTLPFWSPPTNATLRMKEKWRRYAGNLANHEAGHSRIALAALAEAHKQVQQVKGEPDCDRLRNEIEGLVNGVIERYRKLEADYDSRTEHGAKPFAAGTKSSFN
jgi:predicted secreted Zn-dependent protease